MSIKYNRIYFGYSYNVINTFDLKTVSKDLRNCFPFTAHLLKRRNIEPNTEEMSEDSEEDYSDRTISDEDESVCFPQLYLNLLWDKTCVI